MIEQRTGDEILDLGEPERDEISDEDLELVVGGLSRAWVPEPGAPTGDDLRVD